MADLSPYSNPTRYSSNGLPIWAGADDAERLAAYALYEGMYWDTDGSFDELIRTEDLDPLTVPMPRIIVNATSHYLLKGLQIKVDKPDANPVLVEVLEAFLKREKFYSEFHIAKKSGVVRGDFVFHMVADPEMPPGQKISLRSIDPASYFPIFRDDDLDQVEQVRLVEMQADADDPNKTVLRILDYWYDDYLSPTRQVWREEAVWEIEDWNKPEKAKKLRQLLPPAPLPPDIQVIPVWLFPNIRWQGEHFGRSELNGLERSLGGVNQSIGDEDLSLGLMGQGVYATDASRPVDENGNEREWEIAPGAVLEVPGATMFKRLEGVSSVTASQEHLKYLGEMIYQGSGVTDVARGSVDVAVAESGVALALRFMPTLAKIEERDLDGVERLTHLFYNWKLFWRAYEGQDFTSVDILVTLGDKLPQNRPALINELNNMMDRKIISKKYYRNQMELLGYVFPENIDQEIMDEALDALKIQQALNPSPAGVANADGTVDTNQSNNQSKPNESGGTEAISSNGSDSQKK